MIYVVAILLPSILIAIIGIAVLFNTESSGWKFASTLAATFGVAGIVWVIAAKVTSSGLLVPAYTDNFVVQELRVPNGATIQTVVFDDGTIFNLTAASRRHFPLGRVQRRLMIHEPSMHIFWECDGERTVEWISLETKERE